MSGFNKDTMKSLLGEGIPGSQPIGGFHQYARYGNDRAVDRSILKHAFGNQYNSGLQTSPLYYSRFGNSKCGSFRAATNAGDINGTINEGTNKKYGKEHNNLGGNNISRLTNLNGGALTQNGNSFYAGNPKIVYDASDFTRYKKLKAINKNFNDKTIGGDNNYAAQTAWSRLKM